MPDDPIAAIAEPFSQKTPGPTVENAIYCWISSSSPSVPRSAGPTTGSKGRGTAVPLLRVLTGEIGTCPNAERRWNRPQGVRLRRSPPAGPTPRLIVVGLRHPPYCLNDTPHYLPSGHKVAA